LKASRILHSLIPNFLEDASEYAQAEALWKARWDELVERSGQQGLWRVPWLSTSFANGTPCRDGNPIFSAIRPGRCLGVRLIQLAPSDRDDELTFWTDVFAEGEEDAIRELVICSVLTHETLSDALDLMRQWIDREQVCVPRESLASR
jgi:hypothetical protein